MTTKVKLTGPDWPNRVAGRMLAAEFSRKEDGSLWYITVDEDEELSGWYVELNNPDEGYGGIIVSSTDQLNRMQEQVREFHVAFGAPAADIPQLLDDDRWQLRHALIHEEAREYREACVQGDLVEIADALGDLLYVVFGAAIEHGIDLGPVVDEIHRSNMSKLGGDGKPIYREDGKILKGPRYFPPEIGPILEFQR